MAIVNFSDLNIENDKTCTSFTFNEQEILVKKHLKAHEVYDLIMITLQKSEEKGIYNAYKKDMYFHLNLVYLYTNIFFSPEELADELTIYDKLVSSGLLIEVLKHINEDDYKNYQIWLEEVAADRIDYNKSFYGIVDELASYLPQLLESTKTVMEENNLDTSKIQSIQDALK